MLSVLSSSPEFPVVYQSDEEQERLMGLYQDLHSHLHHPTRPLRSFYRCSMNENLLAWVSLAMKDKCFKVFLYFETCSPFVPAGDKWL